ncbi:winged helix-turn-helix transcriptional regulator [Sphingobacterium bambusae]|uniref:Winged helix-turn-helix transcriptional regulator n=1 Tax=Sphingobacterium bambusae TaxID=662858 RepID=A0ABW6BCJ8_9SPHI|nr:helix-turn-helix domain-containing protein [Sphingobacterium bambusae]WPL49128.1 helix-turn-helix domain-containing protein [Sphingobacterium bambusae]
MRKENSSNAHNERALLSNCTAFKTLSYISGRWKLSLLMRLLKGDASYSDFKLLLPDISDRTLSKQLNELVGDGLVLKQKSKTSSQYSLTAKGRKLEEVLGSLATFQH